MTPSPFFSVVRKMTETKRKTTTRKKANAKTKREPPYRFRAIPEDLHGTQEGELLLVLDNDVLEQYQEYYFSYHLKARKNPIPNPYHESINKWMILKRPMMNALKQRWKTFITWWIEEQGLSNLRIDQCDLCFDTYYGSERRHDPDNSCPKFIIDGLVESGFLIDDSDKHIRQLTLRCHSDVDHPRTEIRVLIYSLGREA